MNEKEARALLFELGMSMGENGEEEYCEAIDVALKDMEELKQYREIGTVEECWDAFEMKEEKGFYDDVPDDLKLAVEVIKQYCQNEDCMEDCDSCPYPLGVIRCADKVN